MSLLEAKHITKEYDGRTIIQDISIHLETGELISLLGLSGSGKTTLFQVLSGLTRPEEGEVFLNGREITGKPGAVSYMLQKDLLLPHKKVIDNVSLPLVLKGPKKRDAREAASPFFAEFGLEGYQDQYPENTIPAFQGALDYGADGVEFDVWCTKSQDLLVFHDATLNRMCKKNGSIRSLTDSSRRKYKVTRRGKKASIPMTNCSCVT